MNGLLFVMRMYVFCYAHVCYTGIQGVDPTALLEFNNVQG